MTRGGLLVFLAGCHTAHDGADAPFANDQQVTIDGYAGNAEEPYLTPDGEYLVFDDRSNGTNIPQIYYASRVDDLTFTFVGEVAGVNGDDPSIMPVIDDAGNFYFNSPRPPDRDSAIYRGVWHDDGTVADVAQVSDLVAKPGQIAKTISGVTRDGQMLDVTYCDTSRPADRCGAVAIALRNDDGSFSELDDGSSDPRLLAWQDQFSTIYGMYHGGQHGTRFSGPVMLTPDGRQAYFEQIDSQGGGGLPELNQIFVATRASSSDAFGAPQLVAGQATLADGTPGFNEGTFVSSDGMLLYYHHLDFTHSGDPRDARFSIHVMSRYSP